MGKFILIAAILMLAGCACNKTEEGCFFIGHPFSGSK